MSWSYGEDESPKPVILPFDEPAKKRLDAMYEKVVAAGAKIASNPDRVTYKGKHREGKWEQDVVNGACYANIVSRDFDGVGYGNDWDVDTFIPAKEVKLTEAQVFEFLQDLTQAGLVQEGLEVSVAKETGPKGEKGDMCIKVPSHNGNEQLTYFALCAARWVRWTPGLIAAYLAMKAADSELTIYQALPLLIERFAPGDGHSPIRTGYGTSGCRNPFMFAAVAAFAQNPDHLPGRAKTSLVKQVLQQKPGRRNMLNTQIDNLAGAMSKALKHSRPVQFGEKCHILHPVFSKFFRSVEKASVEKIQTDFVALINNLLKKGIA